MYMIAPGLEMAILPVKVVEESVLLPHKHRNCSKDCVIMWDFTPLVSKVGDSVELHLDSAHRLFPTVHEAERIRDQVRKDPF